MQIQSRIIHSLIIMSILFLSLIGYLTYFELFTKNNVVSNSYNRRLRETEEKVLRGSFYDRNRVVLAQSTLSGNKQERKYLYPFLYSHIIGYNSTIYGKSLLEGSFNDFLSGKNDFNAVFEIKNKVLGNAVTGNHVLLTLDHSLQQAAGNALGRQNGAVVAIQPKTGEILAMATEPDFDPHEEALKASWNRLIASESSPFLPRATSGLYAPGSTFKVLVAAAALEKGMDRQTFEDNGKFDVDGKAIRNFGGTAHGSIHLKKALSVSSNVVFAKIGMDLGQSSLKDIAQRAGFNQEIPLDIPVSRSNFYKGSMKKTEVAAAAIGQGELLVSPLHMAMIAGAIGNKGMMMQPLLVNRIENSDGILMKSQKSPTPLFQVMSPETSTSVKEMMVDVVEQGTGKNAGIQGVKVAGKTGTAENELSVSGKSKDHAWFIGFAPADDPTIAVSVILEYSGTTGGEAAAPIAREVMAAWLSKGK